MAKASSVKADRHTPPLEGLFDCFQAFFRIRDHDRLAHELLQVVTEATDCTRASLMLLDEDERLLYIKAAIGLAPEIVAGTRVRLGEGIAGWVAQNRRPLRLPGSPKVPASIQKAMSAERISSALCVPLQVEEGVIGVLNLARENDRESFTPRDLQFTSIVADRVAMALYTTRLYGELARRERFINHILDSIPSSLVVFDRSLRVVSVNQNFLEKSRRQERTTVRAEIREIFPQVLMDYSRLDEKVRDAFRNGQSMEGGKVAYRAPGLATRIYYYRLVPLRVEGSVENVVLLMDDITEQVQLGEEVRRVERHLASVVECANDLVISIDPDGAVLTWNWAAEKVSGHKTEEAKGQPLLSFCPADQRPVMQEMFQRLAGGETIQNAEANLLTVKGEEVPIAWSCSPMQDDDRRVVGFVAVGRDLTERRRLEAQLIQSTKMASLGMMAGGIAHELRNPLGIISASGQLLLEQPEDERLRNECAQKIHAATQRASTIIENLLKFSRPRGEQMREVDLRAVLEEVIDLLAHQMRLQKITLRRRLKRDLPRVRSNAELLRQVFTNLMLNASNAMPQGGTLKVTTRASADGQVEIRFSDTGHGISSEHLPKIFDPFFTTMPVGKGTGLGLSICYSIIQQHNGAIEVESEVGEGSTFIVRLPCAPNGR